MDELDLLKSMLTKPGPSEDVVRRRRRELQQLIRHRSHARTGRRRGWVAGIGLTAVVAAGAVTAVLVMAPGTHTGGGAPKHSAAMTHHPAAKKQAKQTVQQILLTAAASAQRAAAGSGTYWYVRVRSATDGTRLYLAESWTKRDGQTWIRNQKTGERVFKLPRSPLTLGPFFLGGRELTFGQIQRLPTGPRALTRWIVNNAARHGGKTGGPSPSNARTREDIFDSLTSLLSELPAAPKVRAAAFRALAALPGVTSLGQVGGGQGIRFTLLGGQRATLIIDASTGQIRATNFFVDNQGAEYWQQIPNATITGQWTDMLP